MCPRPSCVFLDLGKVLLDYDFARLISSMQPLAAVDEDQLRRVFSSDSLAQRFETGEASESAFHSEVGAGLDVEITRSDFVEAWNSIFIDAPLLPEDLLAGLAKRVPLWALSNTNPIHFRYAQQHFPVLGHFRGFILSFRAGSRKPDEKIFLQALAEARVESSEALFVDDQLPNVKAAQKLGFDAFQFLNKDQFAAELWKRSLL